MIADRLLARLDGVRQIAPNKWISRCPAHDDRSPSLSIRYVDDRLLIKCFAGCDALSVVQAVGLELPDLFADKYQHHAGTRKAVPDYKSLCILSQYDGLIMALFVADVVAGKTPNPVDVEIFRVAYASFARFSRIDL